MNSSPIFLTNRLAPSALTDNGLLVFILVLALAPARSTAQLTQPLNCSDPQRTCSGFLHYLLPQEKSIRDIEAMFNVWPQDITDESNTTLFIPNSPNQKSLFIKVTCSCSMSSNQYGYKVPVSSSSPNSSSLDEYQGLAWREGTTESTVWLLCGCSSNTWPYLVSHVIQDKDTLDLLGARFDSNISDIALLNAIRDPTFLLNGVVYYIPVNSAPGDPVSISPASNEIEQVPLIRKEKKKTLSLAAIIGVAAAGAVLLAVAVGCAFNFLAGRRVMSCLRENRELETPRTPAFSREMMSKVANIERPLVFSYEEIEASTDSFKETNKLGQGAYGSVFYGFLRGQDVAIKRMKATKAKEFLVEIKVLCKAHHTNLVELIGYASCESELFLVYEYAENKSLSDRLHDPLSKGYTPLSWIARVQIALDSARGLEYIHDHTKTHYLHRDIKTSNILLDGNFRAKIADFGLAKLVEPGDELITRIVGTFGYLAPEYLRDGHATTKSDVYAFGVVLFELITGQEAISKSRQHVPSTPERRSLISIMFSALRDSTSTNIGKLRDVVDPLLENMFPGESLYRVAVLGKQCVEEDPLLRPEMKQVAFSLSHVLFNSIEWEATLAGNSQVFSKIVQGR